MLETESPSFSALQRSKTAPTPLVDEPGASAAQWGRKPVVGRINRSKASGIRTKPKAYAHAGTKGGGTLALDVVIASQTYVRPPLVSPRHDMRENPFNLAGFFPSRPGSPEHAVEWAWRSTVEETVPEVEEEEDEQMEERELSAGWRSVLPTRSLSMNALDEYARDVIAKESELGILGLARVPSFFKNIGAGYFGQAEEDQHTQTQSETPFEISSAALDEPFDAETLCESMHSRRVASERELAPLERAPSFGLFTAAAETREAELGWASALYTKILGPEV